MSTGFFKISVISGSLQVFSSTPIFPSFQFKKGNCTSAVVIGRLQSTGNLALKLEGTIYKEHPDKDHNLEQCYQESTSIQARFKILPSPTSCQYYQTGFIQFSESPRYQESPKYQVAAGFLFLYTFDKCGKL